MKSRLISKKEKSWTKDVGNKFMVEGERGGSEPIKNVARGGDRVVYIVNI